MIVESVIMASSLYDGLEDVELEKKSIGGSAPWVLGHTSSGSSPPMRNETGIGRLVASTGIPLDSSTSMKLMQSHMAAKRAQGKRGNVELSRSSVAPVVDLHRRSGEGSFRFNQMTGKMERVSHGRSSGPLAANQTLPISTPLYGDPILPLGVADEYNPLYPNDFEELARQKREKRKADERALAAARAIEYNSSGMCRRPNVSDSGSDSDVDESAGDERRKRRAGRQVPERSSSNIGAAIAPPSSLMKDVVVAPDLSQPPPDLSATANSEIDYAEAHATGGKFGINVVAAKIMAQMGYRHGQGLGREGQGMSSALVVEKTSRRGGKIIHERDRQKGDQSATPQATVAPDLSAASMFPAQAPPLHATNVVLLRNMCGPGEVDDDLEPETAEECAKYGKVVTCMIFELPDAPDDEAVRIFVEFQEQQAAVRAVLDLNGRFFGGRVVKAGFYDAERFCNLELNDPPLSN